MKTETATTVTDAMYSNKIELDKFYTREAVAIECLTSLDLDDYDLIIEPSAGNGSFFRNITYKNNVGLDLKPGCESVCEQNWFSYEIDKRFKKVLVVGNPPFGVKNQLSKAFLEHASSFDAVQTIAFILPDVFHKHTLQRHIPLAFRLKYSKKLPRDSFEINGVPFNVPCTFFVFDKSIGDDLRFLPEKHQDTKDFVFGTSDNYDFFVMGAAPKNVIDSPNPRNRGYYIKVRESVDVERVRGNLKRGSWDGYSSVSGGVCWFSKPELICHYKKQYEDQSLLEASGQ